MLAMKKFVRMMLPMVLIATTAQANLSNERMSIPSPGMSLINNAQYIKPLDLEQKIHFTVWLKLRNQDKLDQLVNGIYDPDNPNYQTFLTLEEFNRQHAPDHDTELAIQDYFLSLGMEAKVVNHTIRVIGTVQQIEPALHVKMNNYRYHDNYGYSNATMPTLSADLAPHVLAMTGLNTMINMKPHVISLSKRMHPKKLLKSNNIVMRWDNFTPQAQPTTTSLNGISGRHLKTTYNLANLPLVNGVPADGTGQTIVITAGCGQTTAAQIISDGNSYNTANGLPPFSAANFAILNPDGTPYTTCVNQSSNGWETEIALDIEATHTIAPGANIVLILTPFNSDFDTTLVDLVSLLTNNNFTIAGFPNAYVVSNGWGTTEGFGYWPIESTLQLATSFGMSFNFPSGLCGDGTYASPNCSRAGLKNSVSYPASSAYTTAIGGTSVFVDNSWNYAFETVWGTFANNQFIFGGGGGVSKYFGPVTWQNPITYFFAGGYGQLQPNSKRSLPDISMLGDPHTGLIIYQNGSPNITGGTSVGTSLFSGVLTLINQVRMSKNKTPIGLAAPYFYTRNSPLLHSRSLNTLTAPRQVISGASTPPSGAPLSAFTIFNVTYGWDSSLTIDPENQFWNDAIGVGTPNVPNFVSQMATY